MKADESEYLESDTPLLSASYQDVLTIVLGDEDCARERASRTVGEEQDAEYERLPRNTRRQMRLEALKPGEYCPPSNWRAWPTSKPYRCRFFHLGRYNHLDAGLEVGGHFFDAPGDHALIVQPVWKTEDGWVCGKAQEVLYNIQDVVIRCSSVQNP